MPHRRRTKKEQKAIHAKKGFDIWAAQRKQERLLRKAQKHSFSIWKAQKRQEKLLRKAQKHGKSHVWGDFTAAESRKHK